VQLTEIFKRIFICLFVAFWAPLPAWGQLSNILPIADFEDGKMDNWQEKSFVDHTSYSIKQIDNITALKSHSQAAASALYRNIDINIKETSFLNWSWRVENILPGLEERSKDGDDYPARIYVVFKGKYFFTKPRSLIYVWSSNQPKESVWPSAYDSGSIMIAARSNEDKTGRWYHEKRNIKQDILKMFGVDINEIQMVAIMTDSDQSGLDVTSWYGNIFFSSK
jgi:hypothetical protein